MAKFAAAGKETPKKDLGLLAMSYGHVYVASVALQARSEQTVAAFLEAESYPGPALIIAHSPCIAHGYDLVHSPAHQQRAIESWAWPLYRFDPRRSPRASRRCNSTPCPRRCRCGGSWKKKLGSGWSNCAIRSATSSWCGLRQSRRLIERRSLYLQLAGIRVETQHSGEGSMIDLTTDWVGLRLTSPLLVGASPLTDDLEALQVCVAGGAGAVVMRSLFEEQIVAEQLGPIVGSMQTWI